MTHLTLAGRSLLKTPGFTLIAVVTLAHGIGLNTAMFSLMNVILLRPLPFEHSASLVRLFRSTPQDHDGSFAESTGFTFVALVNDVLFRSLPVKNSGDLVPFRTVHQS